MKTIIVYASKMGTTKMIAEYMGSKIGAKVVDAKDDVDISQYDKVILGTGVYAGKPAKSMIKFVEKNKDKLSNASLFVICMYNGDKGWDQLEAITDILHIADAIFFNKPKKQIGIDGSELEKYIASMM